MKTLRKNTSDYYDSQTLTVVQQFKIALSNGCPPISKEEMTIFNISRMQEKISKQRTFVLGDKTCHSF